MASKEKREKNYEPKHMRGALALVGGEEFNIGSTFDAELITSLIKDDISVLLVPTAAAYENPAKKIQEGISYCENLGIKTDVLEIYSRSDAKEMDLNKSKKDRLKKQLEAASIIYLTNGSPMHLQSVLVHTIVFDEIKTAWENGTVLVGAGAGGSILCDYMIDARGGAFTVGLNLISEISMIPGYDLWSEDKIHRTIKLAPSNIFVAGVPLQTALISEAGQPWKEMGLGKVSAFHQGKKITVSDLPPL